MRINILNYYIMHVYNFNNNYHFVIQNIYIYYFFVELCVPFIITDLFISNESIILYHIYLFNQYKRQNIDYYLNDSFNKLSIWYKERLSIISIITNVFVDIK